MFECIDFIDTNDNSSISEVRDYNWAIVQITNLAYPFISYNENYSLNIFLFE